MKNLNSKILILSLAAAAALAAGCRNKDAEALNNLEKDRFLVKTEKAVTRNLEEYILLTGSVKALDEATLYPRTSGKLLRNLLKEGDPVKKDETVALVERDEPGVVYEPAPVPSTLSGVIGRVYQDVGANVTPATPIAMVVNQSQVRVAVDVPEKYVGKVFREGIWASVTGGWYLDPQLPPAVNAIHTLIALVLFLTPLLCYLVC